MTVTIQCFKRLMLVTCTEPVRRCRGSRSTRESVLAFALARRTDDLYPVMRRCHATPNSGFARNLRSDPKTHDGMALAAISRQGRDGDQARWPGGAALQRLEIPQQGDEGRPEARLSHFQTRPACLVEGRPEGGC